MHPLLFSPLHKDSNHFSIGKWMLCVLVTYSFSSSTVGEEKKHRRQVPLPKNEKELEKSSIPTPAINSPTTASPTEASTPRPKAPLTKKEDGEDKKVLSTAKSPRCEEKYPIETFMQIASASSPQASKSGGVYFVSDLREAPQVFSLESPKAWPEQLTFFPDGVKFYSVSPDGLKMLVATDAGGDEQFDIYLLQLKTRVLSPLLIGRNKRVESVRWDSKSNWFVFTSTERNQKDFDLYQYEISTKKQTLLQELSGHNTVSDISEDGTLISLTSFRSVTDSDVLLFHKKEKSLENLTPNPDEYAAEAKFASSGGAIFFLSDENNGTLQLFQMDLKTKNVKPLTSGKWGIDSLELSKDRDTLFYSTNEDGYSQLFVLEIDPRGKKGAPLAAPTITKSVVGGISPAGTYSKGSFFLTLSNSKQTSDVWLWRRGSLSQWTQSTNGPMNKNCFPEEKLIRYPSFDKKEIPAFVYLPKDSSFENPSPVPFIVYIHGGPEAQYRPSFSKTFQYYLQRGFGIFAPNIRGSTGYGRNYTLQDNYKKRMDAIQDIVEGAHWIIKNQLGASKNLSIFGGSYGGFAVLRTIQVEPQLFAAASESVGIVNFITFLENTKPYRRELREIEYGPLSDKEFLKSISPIEYVDQIKTPLLVFHGANDPRVPLSETEQLVSALKKREIPVDFTLFKDEGHGNKKMANITMQAKQMAYFFERYSK